MPGEAEAYTQQVMAGVVFIIESIGAPLSGVEWNNLFPILLASNLSTDHTTATLFCPNLMREFIVACV